jgi:peptidoglycan hydrolase-like protein with peptidoglycan-binding domain
MIRIAAFCLFLCAGPALAQDISVDAALDKEQLKAVQTDLLAIGHEIGKPDGSFGPKSKAAFAAFLTQFAPDLAPVLDPASAAKLDSVATAYTTSPFATAPADAGFLDAGVTFSWDIRNLAEAPCDLERCQPTPELLTVGDLTGDGLPELVYATDLQNPKLGQSRPSRRAASAASTRAPRSSATSMATGSATCSSPPPAMMASPSPASRMCWCCPHPRGWSIAR